MCAVCTFSAEHHQPGRLLPVNIHPVSSRAAWAPSPHAQAQASRGLILVLTYMQHIPDLKTPVRAQVYTGGVCTSAVVSLSTCPADLISPVQPLFPLCPSVPLSERWAVVLAGTARSTTWEKLTGHPPPPPAAFPSLHSPHSHHTAQHRTALDAALCPSAAIFLKHPSPRDPDHHPGPVSALFLSLTHILPPRHTNICSPMTYSSFPRSSFINLRSTSYTSLECEPCGFCLFPSPPTKDRPVRYPKAREKRGTPPDIPATTFTH